MKITISKTVSLPLDLITQTVAILAKRRAGKSYTMRRLVEQLFKAGQQVILVDPKGDQWGVRSSADGKKPGLPIVILGGEHGDAPLEVTSGEVVAKLVVEERVSVLLDLSTFRKHEVATFMTTFLENIYRLKAKEEYRTPVMLVIDEADAIAPQKPQRGEERMLGAAEDIVRRGGQRGIGCCLVTQRSAVLNKNVLTQAQMLVVLRTIAPQDLAAMKAWIEVHGDMEQGKTLMDSLPSLPIGDAWFWSPGWPTAEGIFTRTHVLPIETFDSGATPVPGEKKVVPKNLADVDLEVLKKQMSATIEKAKSDDPKALRKEIAVLKAELAKRPEPKVIKTGPMKIERIEVPTIGKRSIENLLKFEKTMRKMAKGVQEGIMAFETNLRLFEDGLNKLLAEIQKANHPIHTVQMPPKIGLSTPKKEIVNQVPNGDLTGPEQRVLNAIAWMENVGVKGPAKEIVAFLSGYAHILSKGFTNPCGTLRARGLISYPSPGKVSFTELGRNLAQFPDKPGTTEELQRMVLDRLDGPKQRVLKPLLEAYPNALTADDLCKAAGYMHPLSKGFTNPRGKLRTFGLIEYPSPGMIVASPILFIS